MSRFARLHSGGENGIISHIDTKEGKTMKDIIRKTPEFQALRAQAQEAIADYAGGADFDWTISRLAPIGEKMTELLS